MASIIEIILQAQDQTGPAFASAQANLLGFSQASASAQTGIVRLGQSTTAAAAQTGTGLARIEQRAEGAASAIITVGIAGSTTETRMRSLGVTIQNQEQQLAIYARRLQEVRAAHDADSLAVANAKYQYDRLNRTLENNYARLNDLKRSGDTTGVQVVGMGVGAAGGAAAAEKAYTGQYASLAGTVGALGLTLGTREFYDFSKAALLSANSLEKTEATIRALSITQERYTDVLRIARRNQELYGGTFQTQLTGMRALIPLATSTDAALSDLNDTMLKLGAAVPEQGPEGAAFALREFLTGTGAEAGLSLQERFNLPKGALTAIATGTTDPAERLAQLNTLMTQQGITQELLTAQTDTTAASYDRLYASWDRFKNVAGGRLARAFEGPAQATSGILKMLIGDFRGGASDIWNAPMNPTFEADNPARKFLPEWWLGPPPAGATVAPGGSAPAAGPVTNVTVNVAGSVTAERDLTDRIRRNLIQIGRQNGINPVAP